MMISSGWHRRRKHTGQLNNNQAFGEPPTPEPSDYPGNFSLDLVGLVANLSWVDAGGDQLPENYLVHGR